MSISEVDVHRVEAGHAWSPYQQYIYVTRYARWRHDLGRRELWHETVDRYCNWMVEQAASRGWSMGSVADEVRDGILHLRALPSMRALMSAGAALTRDNVAGYNCAYLPIDDPRAFDETMYILMCGTGVGFSVERQFVDKLPMVPGELFPIDDKIVVADSRRGWAGALRRLVALLWTGHIPQWDMSFVRPAGAPLKTFGGRASGPAPLDDLFRYIVRIFESAKGRRLTSLECHGIMCKIGDIVVVGGVRRSALISLSNPSDERMRDAKSGAWVTDPMREHFRLANNSAAWTDKPDALRYFNEITALIRSRSGERGIINRNALQQQAARWGRRSADVEYGVNPCSEIILRPCQFCNLSTIVVRASDDIDDLNEKARLATIMGGVQSTLTDFEYLRDIWRENCEEERLLGVSLGGQMDHPILSEVSQESQEWLTYLREQTRAVDETVAREMNLEPSASITCQKPEGTTSQLVDAASGGHRRHSPYYIRRTRGNKNDPAVEAARRAGIPCEEDVHNDSDWVLSWPIRAPKGAKTREDEKALEQLKMWLHVNKHWCEHKPSVTVSVREEEWPAVAAFVYENWDEMSGVSFLPHEEHIYQQAPYEAIVEERYEELAQEMPKSIDWSVMNELETEDRTTNTHDLACTAGQCELQ